MTTYYTFLEVPSCRLRWRFELDKAKGNRVGSQGLTFFLLPIGGIERYTGTSIWQSNTDKECLFVVLSEYGIDEFEAVLKQDVTNIIRLLNKS